MASTVVSNFDAGNGRLFTAADLAALPTHLPSGDVDYELDQGRLIVMVPPGHLHGAVQVRLGSALFAQGEERGHGQAFTEVGVMLSRNPDTVAGPDVAFVVAAKLPVRESREGYLETIPDLVVEIGSKNDTRAELDRKVAAYLSAGVRVVWVADPESKTITVHRAGIPPRVFREADTLTADELIPGFSMPIAAIFRKQT